MFQKKLATLKANEFGNSQAVVEWVAIAALVLGVCTAAFAALGSSNAALLDSFTQIVDTSNDIVNNAAGNMSGGAHA